MATRTKVSDIQTLPPEFIAELREFMSKNSIGETIDDFLEFAKKKGVKIFPVPYLALLQKIGH